MLDFQLVSYRQAATPVRLTRIEIVHPGGVKYAIFRFSYDTFTVGWPGYIDFTVAESAAFPYEANMHSPGVHNGWVIFGEATEAFIQNNTPGIYSFETQVEPALVSFQDKHRVETVTATDGITPGDTLVGAVQIQEGYNCNVGVSSSLNRIRISASVGAGAGMLCTPIGTGLNCDQVLLRINGLHADDNGNLMLMAGSGMEAAADPDNNRIILRSVQPKEELVC